MTFVTLAPGVVVTVDALMLTNALLEHQFSVTREGSTLLVNPADRLTADIRAAIADHCGDLLTICWHAEREWIQ